MAWVLFKFERKETQQSTNVTSYRHGGGCVMVWGCFASSGCGQLVIIDRTSSALYQKMLKENQFVTMELKHGWITEQDCDL